MNYYIIVKHIALYFVGMFLLSSYAAILIHYDTPLKEDNWLFAFTNFCWGVYLFAKATIEIKKSK
jgi:hypothetical protein